MSGSAAIERWPAEYVVPIRWNDDRDLEEFTDYLRGLSGQVDVTVVDGSPAARFAEHHAKWPFVRHLSPTWAGLNGKARGAMTGLSVARHERVVIADDDVRYDARALRAVLKSLESVDLVRPQNHYDPRPWQARWDTGRILIGRALGGDFPGTLAVRRSVVLRDGGYDTNVLFENLELERTVRARGGRTIVARDVFVARRPPSTRRFWEQRVRQAYDESARPARLALELALLPALVLMIARRDRAAMIGLLVVLVATAEWGRRINGGARVFTRDAALWSPLWAAERAVTAWLAIAVRLRGGVRYRDAVIRRAATPLRRLRRDPA